MKKVALINLKEIFSLYSIVETKTFEPVYLEWEEDTKPSLLEYSLVVYYNPIIDIHLIRNIRKSLSFHNIKFLVFCDSINIEQKKKILQSGADYAELLPMSDEEFVHYLQEINSLIDKSAFFNKEVITPFVLSTEEILNMMAVISASLDQVYLSTTPLHFGDVSGVMALAGERKGVIMISFFESYAKKIISSIMAVPEEEISEDDENDGVGELINMIAGGAKARLGESEGSFYLSAPSVVTGNQHRVIQQKDIPCVVMVFKTEDDYFAVQLCLMSLGIDY